MSAVPPIGVPTPTPGEPMMTPPSPHVSVTVAAAAAAAERAAAARDAETTVPLEAAVAEFWHGIDDDSSESQGSITSNSQAPSDDSSPPSTGRSGETWPPHTRLVPLGRHDMEPPRLITYDMEALLSRISASTPSFFRGTSTPPWVTSTKRIEPTNTDESDNSGNSGEAQGEAPASQPRRNDAPSSRVGQQQPVDRAETPTPIPNVTSVAVPSVPATSPTVPRPAAKTIFVPRLSMKSVGPSTGGLDSKVHPMGKKDDSARTVDDGSFIKIANADKLMWYMTDEEHPMVVNGCVLLESPISLGHLIERSLELVQEYPILSCKISSDFRWVPVQFDPSKHSSSVVLGPHETMEEYMGSVVALPIDFNRPMWEWTIVSKPDTNEHVLVVRVHHVVGDGVALMTLLNHLLGKEAMPLFKRSHIIPMCRTITCGDPCLVNVAEGNWKAFCGVTRLLCMVLLFPLIILSIVFLGRDKRTVLTQKSAHRARVTWWSKKLSHETVTNIGASIHGTVNDTCCAILSGALAKYLERMEGKRFRGHLKCIIPVSVRSKKETYQLNNRVGALFLKLPVGATTPRRRLELCKHRMDWLKLGPSVPVTMLFIRLTTKMLNNWLCNFLQQTYSQKATLIFSNVMGSPTEATFLGARVGGIMGFVPLPGHMSLGVTVTTFNGSMRFGLVADPNALTDPALFGKLIEEEYQILREECLGKMYTDSSPRDSEGSSFSSSSAGSAAASGHVGYDI
mmetsp:Transcript_32063/g.74001  ORF Transcript_32063/g.74001 Transcript_32063/m.74001 type:complete len:737 (-) Transcript_32063:34-2244(-)|eukprot:CAMPEP_0182570720 /NCGR_PEP_ID=MMETSP1324-20130603/10950_1 /TAXON_ID=236786 /ORGANISM="Florenciella sp., Strain RCC1587" /LENGTH=736 /DNA_ID=CAMNT_0024785145 /DNA_START=93 /DNA_END=2303 /DNA_ORIENTATION=-